MLQIRKLSNKTWKHIDSIDGAFILTKFYAKEEFNEFLIVESYGAKRRKYLINEIEVYDIGGTAETFANFEDLFLRLEALKYTGFYKDGDIDLVWGSIIGNLSDQTDLQNALDANKWKKEQLSGFTYKINIDNNELSYYELYFVKDDRSKDFSDPNFEVTNNSITINSGFPLDGVVCFYRKIEL